jgi:muramoyltetrapeptide carboxypeptidase
VRSRVIPTLAVGDAVGVIAPAGPVDPGRLRHGMERLAGWGLRPVAGEHVFRVSGYLAGSDGERVADLTQAMTDDKLSGVFYARGGYGTTRLLARLDLDRLAASQRLLVGYSDATALGLALSVREPYPYLHGPSVADLGSRQPDVEEASLVAGLFGNHPGGRQVLAGLEPIQGGVARGIALGGCLSLVCALIGTPYEPPLAERILFLEEVNEEPYRLDRMLTHLAAGGRLDRLAGLLLGQFTDCASRDPRRPSFSAAEVLEEFARSLGVPVLAGLPAGHGPEQVTIPLGVEVGLNADAGEVVFHHC